MPSVLLNKAWAADQPDRLLTMSREIAQAETYRARLSKILRQIIRDPGNIELNIRYAKLAEMAGVPRRALAAYERIQASHPGNETAIMEINRLRDLLGLAAIEPKKKTKYSIVLGASFETNAASRETEFASYDSAASSAAFGIGDDRTLIRQADKNQRHPFLRLS